MMFIVFNSCDNGQNQNGKEDNNTATETTSTDLAFFDLQGPVKSYNGIEFDQSGRITTIDGIDPFAIDGPYRDYDEETGSFAEYCQWERDDEGNISSTLCIESVNYFVWENGRKIGENGAGEGIEWSIEYKYDADGRLIETDFFMNEYEGEQMDLEEITRYEYLDTDDHGNWTRRKEKYFNNMDEFQYEDEVTRSIIYY